MFRQKIKQDMFSEYSENFFSVIKFFPNYFSHLKNQYLDNYFLDIFFHKAHITMGEKMF